jgi:hypothetical protein
MEEQDPLKVKVEGSSPSLPAILERLKYCHSLLQEAWAMLDPEQHPDLCERLYQELKDCDGDCPSFAPWRGPMDEGK